MSVRKGEDRRSDDGISGDDDEARAELKRIQTTKAGSRQAEEKVTRDQRQF